jgi:hypothetical protein
MEHFQIAICIELVEYIHGKVQQLSGELPEKHFRFDTSNKETMAGLTRRAGLLHGIILSHKKSARFGSF